MIVTSACAKGQSVGQLCFRELQVGRATAPTTPLWEFLPTYGTLQGLVLHPSLVPESPALSRAMHLQLVCILKCKI